MFTLPRPDGTSTLTLSASSNPGSGARVGTTYYRFGESMTGWVAKHRKSVGFKDTADEHERERIRALHRVDEPIRRSERSSR